MIYRGQKISANVVVIVIIGRVTDRLLWRQEDFCGHGWRSMSLRQRGFVIEDEKYERQVKDWFVLCDAGGCRYGR